MLDTSDFKHKNRKRKLDIYVNSDNEESFKNVKMAKIDNDDINEMLDRINSIASSVSTENSTGERYRVKIDHKRTVRSTLKILRDKGKDLDEFEQLLTCLQNKDCSQALKDRIKYKWLSENISVSDMVYVHRNK